MAWVKKNLVLLIAAVISLGALGYAIFFVKQKMDSNTEVTTSLDESANKFKDLLSRKQHPGNEKQDNIKAAKEELVRIRNFSEEMKEYLKGSDLGTNTGNSFFRALLDTSLTELRREAIEAGVTLPSTNYWFTFNSYKTVIDFKGDVPGLTAELEDIKNLMHIMYDSRVHSVVAFKRAAVSEADFTGTSDFFQDGKQVRTNDWAVTTSYEITFQGFSGELARVMEGMANAKQCYVVKKLGVGQAPDEKKPAPSLMMMQQQMIPSGPMADRYRYMSGPRFAPPPQPIAPTAKALPKEKIILDEHPLRFTLTLDSVRLKPRGR
jgi:hypothetical protein